MLTAAADSDRDRLQPAAEETMPIDIQDLDQRRSPLTSQLLSFEKAHHGRVGEMALQLGTCLQQTMRIPQIADESVSVWKLSAKGLGVPVWP